VHENIITILHLALCTFLNFLGKLEIAYTIASDFNGTLYVRPQNSFCKIRGRLNSSGLNPMTIKSGKQCSNAQKRIRDVSELKQWMIDM